MINIQQLKERGDKGMVKMGEVEERKTVRREAQREREGCRDRDGQRERRWERGKRTI